MASFNSGTNDAEVNENAWSWYFGNCCVLMRYSDVKSRRVAVQGNINRLNDICV